MLLDHNYALRRVVLKSFNKFKLDQNRSFRSSATLRHVLTPVILWRLLSFYNEQYYAPTNSKNARTGVISRIGFHWLSSWNAVANIFNDFARRFSAERTHDRRRRRRRCQKYQSIVDAVFVIFAGLKKKHISRCLARVRCARAKTNGGEWINSGAVARLISEKAVATLNSINRIADVRIDPGPVVVFGILHTYRNRSLGDETFFERIYPSVTGRRSLPLSTRVTNSHHSVCFGRRWSKTDGRVPEIATSAIAIGVNVSGTSIEKCTDRRTPTCRERRRKNCARSKLESWRGIQNPHGLQGVLRWQYWCKIHAGRVRAPQ